METLSGKPLLRRVLATLPAWYSDEDEARLDAEAKKEKHERVRAHSLEEMVAELAANPHAQLPVEEPGEGEPETRRMIREEVQRCLDWLVAQGWVSFEDRALPPLQEATETQPAIELDPVRYYRMTRAGFEELHRPEAAAANVVPGPVQIDPQPAVIEPDNALGVSASE